MNRGRLVGDWFQRWRVVGVLVIEMEGDGRLGIKGDGGCS
jgi:hypothetical protein